MQAIAQELNLSETVFLSPHNGHQDSFQQRIFTPKGEVDFAGHTLLATAHVLAETNAITLKDKNTRIMLKLPHQDVEANITQRDGKPSFVQFTLQCSPVVDRFTPPESELANLLSIQERDIDTATYHVRLVSGGKPYLIVPVTSQDVIRRASFDLKAWSQASTPAIAAQEILLFSSRTNSNDAEFHGRLFGPMIGVHEDPPIGACIPSFAGYLSTHDHIREGTYTFAIDRGTRETRRSLIHVEMDKRAGRPITVRVGGECVLVSESTLHLN
jgi:trans-2,3-dihydro-3-hydroxyanthranilate isomerase